MPKRIKEAISNQYVKIIGTVAAIIAIIGGVAKVIEWVDDHYIDQQEMISIVESVSGSTNKNLEEINRNIILLGNAFYDQRIAEIESLIGQVEKIENKNQTELQFLESLKKDLAELNRQQEKLQRTHLMPVGNLNE